MEHKYQHKKNKDLTLIWVENHIDVSIPSLGLKFAEVDVDWNYWEDVTASEEEFKEIVEEVRAMTFPTPYRIARDIEKEKSKHTSLEKVKLSLFTTEDGCVISDPKQVMYGYDDNNDTWCSFAETAVERSDIIWFSTPEARSKHLTTKLTKTMSLISFVDEFEADYTEYLKTKSTAEAVGFMACLDFLRAKGELATIMVTIVEDSPETNI